MKLMWLLFYFAYSFLPFLKQVHLSYSVNWTGEDLSRSTHSQSQPQLRASMRSVAGAPLPPPRRPLAGIVRSRSTDVVVPNPDDPRPTPRLPFAKQKALPEDDPQTPSSNTPPEEESTDSSLMEDEGLPKPRKRRLNLPFGKKTKTPAWQPNGRRSCPFCLERHFLWYFCRWKRTAFAWWITYGWRNIILGI